MKSPNREIIYNLPTLKPSHLLLDQNNGRLIHRVDSDIIYEIIAICAKDRARPGVDAWIGNDRDVTARHGQRKRKDRGQR